MGVCSRNKRWVLFKLSLLPKQTLKLELQSKWLLPSSLGSFKELTVEKQFGIPLALTPQFKLSDNSVYADFVLAASKFRMVSLLQGALYRWKVLSLQPPKPSQEVTACTTSKPNKLFQKEVDKQNSKQSQKPNCTITLIQVSSEIQVFAIKSTKKHSPHFKLLWRTWTQRDSLHQAQILIWNSRLTW